jgi:hypothetical protein
MSHGFQRLSTLVASIKAETDKRSPNRLTIAQAAEDIQKLIPQLEHAKASSSPKLPAQLSSPGAGLSVGDGFRFGCGFYVAIVLGTSLLVSVLLITMLILGALSIGGLLNQLGTM